MNKDKWDLTRVYEDKKDFLSDIQECYKLLDKIATFEGKIKDSLLEFLKLDEKIDYLLEKTYVYSHLLYYEDMLVNESEELKEKAIKLCDDATSIRSFISVELLSYDKDEIMSLIDDDKELESYRISLERIYRFKPHSLSYEEESLLSNASSILDGSEEAFSALNNADIKFDKIKDEEGKSRELSQSNYSNYIMSKSRKVRKNAFENMFKFYGEHINSISSLYINKIKTDTFISKTRKYDSTLNRDLFSNNIDESLYNKLIDITNKNTFYLREYYNIKKKMIGIKELHMYDLYVNIIPSLDRTIEYEECKNIVVDALNPLGKEYVSELKHLLDNNCVDVLPKKGKRSGAYQWGIYGYLPYVSINFENKLSDTSTLAHEMGHAMHSFYSDKFQDYQYAGYPIFLAEIASTVNEILLNDYLYDKSTSKEERIYYLCNYLDNFKSTVYRQTMFAEFERDMHSIYENGGTLTKDTLCNHYLELNKKEFGSSVKVDDEIKYEWARIPHFYTEYYVYMYATGFMVASVIASRLKQDESFKDKYIKFLSSGCIKYPLDLLKEMDIDITEDNVINNAFEIFKEKLELLKKEG